MPIFIISIIIQLALVVHVLKTGRSNSWIFILLMFPLIGGLAYFIVELLPALSNSSTAKNANRKASAAMNPHRIIRQAAENLAVADTIENTVALAKECINKGDYGEAEKLFERAMKGMYADDPMLSEELAGVYYLQGKHDKSKLMLDQLIEKHPDHKSQDGHLLYAKVLIKLGHIEEAKEEFKVLKTYYPGPEPSYRLGMLLKAEGDREGANRIFSELALKAKRSGSHYNKLYKTWIKKASEEV